MQPPYGKGSAGNKTVYCCPFIACGLMIEAAGKFRTAEGTAIGLKTKLLPQT
jgi:hypothetical protein